MPIVLLWAVPAIIAVGGGVYLISHMHYWEVEPGHTRAAGLLFWFLAVHRSEQCFISNYCGRFRSS